MSRYWFVRRLTVTLIAFGLEVGIAFGVPFEQETEVNPVALSWFRKGEALIGTDQEFSAEQVHCFEKALEFAPDFAPAIYNLALILSRQGDFAKVAKLADRLIALEPDDARGYRFRGRAAAELGDSEGALHDLSEATRLSPDDFWAWEELGQLQYSARHFEAALAAFQHLLELRPNSSEVCFNMALAQQSLGRLDEAAESFQRFLQDHPDDFQAHYSLGLLYRERGLNQEALQELRAAEALDPNQADLKQMLGELYLDLGNFQEARARLEQGGPEPARNLGNLGILAKQQHQPKVAAEYLRQALALEPTNALLWAHLGDVLASLDQNKEAAEAYQRAIQYDPKDFDSHLNLGALLANYKQNALARPFLEKAVELRPDSGSAHFQLGIVLERLIEPDLAQAQYLKALDLGYVNPLLHFRLAILFARQKEAVKAIDQLRTSFRLEPHKYVPIVLEELKNVTSDLDSIRYETAFRDLLEEYRPYWYADQEPVPVPASPAPQ